MGILSSFGSFCSRVASSVASGVGSVLSAAKNVVTKAVTFIAEKADVVISAVKNTWEVIKPHIGKARIALQLFAKSVPIPWMKAVALGLDRGLAFLETIEKSELAKKISKAIDWVIEASKNFKEKILTPLEMREAEQRKAELDEASQVMSGAEKKSIQLTSLINDYLLIQSRIEVIFNNDAVQDFQHYLRLRATQKILRKTVQTLSVAQSSDEITEDDIFLTRVGAVLLETDPSLSESDTVRFNRIVKIKFGKELIPFVFEEMIGAWTADVNDLQLKWNEANDKVAVRKREIKTLEREQKLGKISNEHLSELKKLKGGLPDLVIDLEALGEQKLTKSIYVSAAEGFIQLLEKTEEELIKANQQYLITEGEKVGFIVTQAMEQNKKLSDLSTEEQSLVNQFANVFAASANERAKQLIEVTV